MNKTKTVQGVIQDRRLREDRFIVRTQAVIRAAGPPAAPALTRRFATALHFALRRRSR